MTDSSVNLDVRQQETNPTLLERIKNREPEGWERFVHLYTPLLRDWCRRAGLQRDDAADVMQDVFCAVSAHIDTFRRDRPGDTFRGWLRTITRTKVIDRLRIQNRPGVRGIGGNDTTLSREESVVNDAFSIDAGDFDKDDPENDELTLMRRAVDMVLENYEGPSRSAFVRVLADGVPAGDVAAELNITVNSVYLAKSRIMRRIRAEFAGLIETL